MRPSPAGSRARNAPHRAPSSSASATTRAPPRTTRTGRRARSLVRGENARRVGLHAAAGGVSGEVLAVARRRAATRSSVRS
jgi:hypothetical protein